jgi:hypothetical protein
MSKVTRREDWKPWNQMSAMKMDSRYLGYESR